MKEGELRKITEYIEQAKSNLGKARIDALQKIWDAAEKEENRDSLCQSSLGLLPTLSLILQTDVSSDTREKATGVLWYLSRNSNCARMMSAPEANLLQLLITMIWDADYRSGNYFEHIRKVLKNLSLEATTHANLIRPEVRYFEFFAHRIERAQWDVQMVSTLGSFLKVADKEQLGTLLTLPITRVFFETLLRLGPDPTQWNPRKNGLGYWCLGYFSDLSYFPVGIEAIRALQGFSFFEKLSAFTDGTEGVAASILLANCYGQEEGSGSSKALLTAHEPILVLLLDLIYFTIHYDKTHPKIIALERIGFEYSAFSLRAMTAALKNLSISDANKTVLLKYLHSILTLSTELLQVFFDNRPPYAEFLFVAKEPAGGGGEDFDTAEHVLEMLLQLSFAFEDDGATARREAFCSVVANLPQLLEGIGQLPNDRKLPFEIRQHASSLLNRLVEKPSAPEPEPDIPVAVSLATVSSSGKTAVVVSSSPALTTPRRPQHIMISYAWANNKTNVIALTHKLRDLGYDVWRDEDGSSLCPPVSGDIVEAMAEAIQHSYLVIICVSPQYKESVNCRAEAKYAQARVHSHNLRLLYVMVDEQYHTRSSNRVVDGWLGFMVGSDLWYPIWDSSQIEHTARSISLLIGENCKRPANAMTFIKNSNNTTATLPATVVGPLPVTSSATTNEKQGKEAAVIRESISTSVSRDYAKAWECLQNPVRVKDPEALKQVLEDLGVVDLSDFEEVQEKDMEVIAGLLKSAPESKFRKALQLL